MPSLNQSDLQNILAAVFDRAMPTLAQFEYRLVGTAAALLQGVPLPVRDVDVLMKEHAGIDALSAALAPHFKCLTPPTYLPDMQQYYAAHEVNGVEVGFSTVELESDSDCIETFGRGPWEHFVLVPCGVYTIPAVTLGLRLITELYRDRPDRYTPLIQYMQAHGSDLDLVRRGMQACKLPEALQRDVLNQLQQGTVTKSNGRVVEREQQTITMDEAVKLIKQSAECFVVWRTDTGEIVNVSNLKEEATADDRIAQLSQMIQATPPNVQYAGRFLQSANVTESTLEKEQDKFLQQNARVTILNEWTRQPAPHLVYVLETGDFPYPTSRSDSYILVEQLFDFHWQELTKPLIRRLWNLVDAEALDSLANATLRLYLYLFEQRTNDFIDYWMTHYHGRTIIPFLAMRCAGDLRISDKCVIGDLIDTLKANIPFGSKHSAMIALGRIGSAAGEEAAKVIREVVYDSSPEISRQRDLVIKRILTSPDDWGACNVCHNGRVIDQTYRRAIMKECENCYGLGFVRRGASET